MDKCGQHLEVTKHTLRKPKIIIYNVSEDLDLENASAVIIDQNPELKLNEEDIVAKYKFKTKWANII